MMLFHVKSRKILTVQNIKNELEKIVEALRRGGGSGKPMYIKLQISYARKDDEALKRHGNSGAQPF